MHFTIPATKYTKAIVVSVTLNGAIVAFMDDVKKATKGDECWFFTKHGFSSYKLENDY